MENDQYSFSNSGQCSSLSETVENGPNTSSQAELSQQIPQKSNRNTWN